MLPSLLRNAEYSLSSFIVACSQMKDENYLQYACSLL